MAREISLSPKREQSELRAGVYTAETRWLETNQSGPDTVMRMSGNSHCLELRMTPVHRGLSIRTELGMNGLDGP